MDIIYTLIDLLGTRGTAVFFIVIFFVLYLWFDIYTSKEI